MFPFSRGPSTGGASQGLFALLGTIVHSIQFGKVELIEHAAILYDSRGVIEQVVDLDKQPHFQAYMDALQVQVTDYTGKLIVPGFVDAHCHAPQYVFSGTGMDLPLLEWLQKYTFPCEARFKDVDFARLAYEKSIRRHLKCGTTFASYFATIHYDACKVLVDVIQQVGQRAHVGKVNMDRNCPDYYIEGTLQGCNDAEQFIQYVLAQTSQGKEYLSKRMSHPMFLIESMSMRRARTLTEVNVHDPAQPPPVPSDEIDWSSEMKSRRRAYSECTMSLTATAVAASLEAQAAAEGPPGCTVEHFIDGDTLLNKYYTPLVMPCVTPRFVPTCTAEMMHRLGELSLKYGLPVQSHMSESVNEIEWVSALHPECRTYAGVYEKHGLLHDACYMAHCCHSTAEERAVLARASASVVHCASSNFMLSSGVMDVRLFLEEGIKVALGTDVAGGYSPSMLDALRQTVVASRVKGFDFKRTQDSSITSSDDDSADMTTVATEAAPYKCLSYLEAFHLATVGGAEVLGMGEVLGNFLVGKKLDCLIVDVCCPNTPIDTFEHETSFELFQKFLFLGDDRNITDVYVDGRKVI